MLKVTSPYDLSLIKELEFNTKEDIEKALTKANELSNNHSSTINEHKRISILEKTAQLMESQIDDLIKTATLEGGKPLTDSKVEVIRAINGVKLAKESIAQLKGEQIPMGLTEASNGRIAFTTKEPIGVVVSISAFNHPLNLIVHQVVTAVAAGCPVIIKPALTTPLSCLKLVSILYEAGLPEEWCQVIICNDENAEILASDRRVNFLSFIGSAKVGWYLRSKLAPGARCALEHGGVAPVIIEDDANLKKVIPAIARGGFYHAGQVCVSVQKVFVRESISEEFIKSLEKEVLNLKTGNPLDEDTQVGPLISPKEVDRVKKWVDEAISEGAELLLGGNLISDTCFEPTILINPSEKSKVSTQEIFGPVVCIYTYNELQEAINIANSLDVHFQASIFTENIDKAFKAVKQLNAATVMINDSTAFRVDWMPFGGRNHSGLGVGGILQTMKEMTQEKLTVYKSHN